MTALEREGQEEFSNNNIEYGTINKKKHSTTIEDRNWSRTNLCM